MLRSGDFFTGPFPPGSNKIRRFIVVTDEVSGECTVVWVFASTTSTDKTVVLPAGCHPWITAECSIVYEKAVIADADQIRKAERQGALTRATPLLGAALVEVQDGIFISGDTPIEVVDYCTDRI